VVFTFLCKPLCNSGIWTPSQTPDHECCTQSACFPPSSEVRPRYGESPACMGLETRKQPRGVGCRIWGYKISHPTLGFPEPELAPSSLCVHPLSIIFSRLHQPQLRRASSGLPTLLPTPPTPNPPPAERVRFHPTRSRLPAPPPPTPITVTNLEVRNHGHARSGIKHPASPILEPEQHGTKRL